MKYSGFYKNSRTLNAILLVFVAMISVSAANAQTVQGAGSGYISIGDTSILVNGATYSDNFRVQFNGGGAPLSNWKLTVQPLTAYWVAQQSSSGDIAQYGYGPNWPLQYWAVRLNTGSSQNSWSNSNSVNQIGANSGKIQLTSSEITLVERSNYTAVASDYFSMSYDMILTGSRQMMSLHRDDYVVVLRFRLYNSSGALVSQADYNHKIGLWPGWMTLPQSTTPAIPNQILLQNGGSNVALAYGPDASAYTNGVEATIASGLKVSSTDGKYQVTVQTVSDYFTKSGAISTIPVSTIKLTAAAADVSVASSYTPRLLGASAKTIITNNGSAGVVNNYNLTYSTKQNTNQSAFLNVGQGTYETQVTFILSPL